MVGAPAGSCGSANRASGHPHGHSPDGIVSRIQLLGIQSIVLFCSSILLHVLRAQTTLPLCSTCVHLPEAFGESEFGLYADQRRCAIEFVAFSRSFRNQVQGNGIAMQSSTKFRHYLLDVAADHLGKLVNIGPTGFCSLFWLIVVILCVLMKERRYGFRGASHPHAWWFFGQRGNPHLCFGCLSSLAPLADAPHSTGAHTTCCVLDGWTS